MRGELVLDHERITLATRAARINAVPEVAIKAVTTGIQAQTTITNITNKAMFN
jgi:hypothetical protein